MKNVSQDDNDKIIENENILNQKQETSTEIPEKHNKLSTHNLFSIMIFFTTIGILLMITKLDEFTNKLIEFNPGYDFPKISDFKITFSFMPICIFLKILIESVAYPLMRYISKIEYLDEKDTNNYKLGLIYTKKNCTNIFKLCYYIFVVIIGFLVLKDLDYFPKTLMGNGEYSNMFEKGYPDLFFHTKPAYFNYYYLGCLAFHITDLIWLVFIYELQTDFLMMILHHMCTVSLIIMSYLSNYSNVGSIILFLHDFGDIFVYITRLFLNTNSNDFLKVLSGFVLLLVFGYTRIYVYGIILYETFRGLSTHFNMINKTLWGLLCFLYILHVLWVYMILKKISTALFVRKYEDSFKIKK